MQYRYHGFTVKEDNNSWYVYSPEGDLVEQCATQSEAESLVDNLWGWAHR